MKWDESKTSDVLVFRARVSDLEVNVITEIWLKFLAIFNGVYSGEWDAIKIEIWADSGRIIIFPGVADKADRDEDFCLEVFVGSIFDFWENLSESDIDDDAFDNQVNGYVRKLIEELIDGLKDVLNSDSTLRPCMPLGVVFSDGEETIVQASV